MPRHQLLLLLLASAATLGATGCGQAVGRQVNQQPPAPLDQPSGDEDGNYDDVRTPLIRALLEKLDELDVPNEFAEDGYDKDSLREMLLAADDELADNTGDQLKAKILRANQRRPALIVRPQRFVETVIEVPTIEVEVAPAAPAAEELPPERDILE